MTALAVEAPAPPSPRAGGQRLRLLVALLAGGVLYLAFPPVDLPVLAPIGPALLVLACRGATARRGALLGLLCGLALFLPLLEWAGTIAGPGAWIALALLQAAFFAPMGAALAMVTRLHAWPLWSALLWVLAEALRSRLPFGGFPWGRLAFSQGDSLLTPLAALGGAPLVSLAVALVGGGIAAAAVLRRPFWLLLPAAVVGAAFVVPTPVDGEPLRVAVVQGNVPRLGLDFNAQRSAVLRNHVDATRQLAADVRAGREARPDVVVWPENASDLDPFSDALAYDLIDDAVRDVGVPVLVGALVETPDGTQLENSGIVWDPVAGPGQRYVKRHPVPFGEYIPLRALVRRITDKVDLVPRDFARGTATGALPLGPTVVGDVICFEVAYDDLVRDVVEQGGRLLVVQTNNATFGRSGESPQQLAMGRLRAVEHGRSVLVAATSGISAVIAPDGRLIDRAEVFTRKVMVHKVPQRDGRTVATRLGGLPELGMSVAALAPLVLLLRRRRST